MDILHWSKLSLELKLTFRALALGLSEYAGLAVEKLAFQIFHGGYSTFLNSFDKTEFSSFTLPPIQHHSFFKNNKFVNIEICLS